MVTIYDFYFVINGFVKKKKRKFYMSKKDPNPLPLIPTLTKPSLWRIYEQGSDDFRSVLKSSVGRLMFNMTRSVTLTGELCTVIYLSLFTHKGSLHGNLPISLLTGEHCTVIYFFLYPTHQGALHGRYP